ncbi:hypothetical protein KW851_28585 [Pseudomonas sp. PDM33]|uniref:hypothetical protein n=1 Tax=unclassified Pseudomonas TaxID=196821 RepID=UPI000B0C4EAC|nr:MULTISPECIES: hypothetical protein [unclassified Pseudomonas]MBV7586818.1 hypothetical protein [Pseudomonas sp. PDM33]
MAQATEFSGIGKRITSAGRHRRRQEGLRAGAGFGQKACQRGRQGDDEGGEVPGRAFSSPLPVQPCILQMTKGQHACAISSNNNLLSG